MECSVTKLPGDRVAKSWTADPPDATMLLDPGPFRICHPGGQASATLDQKTMDRLDRRILELLQQDGSLTAAEIAERVGLSKAPCWRRIQRLQETGVIARTVALVDPKAVNLGTTVFVTVKTSNHSAAWFEQFVRTVRDIPEITEIHRVSGEVDYLLRIVVPNIDAYDVVYKRLIAGCAFLDVSASFSLETIKQTTALPLNYAATED
jgi:Lrp/AsnC family transcriptional regulator